MSKEIPVDDFLWWKRKTNGLITQMVKMGLLKRPKFCSMCGVRHYHIYGHHDNYFKPLKVRWVCPKCHRSLHPNPRGYKRKKRGCKNRYQITKLFVAKNPA